MRAGMLRQRVNIQQATETQSSSGEVQDTAWTNFAADVWAAIEPLRGREAFDYSARQEVSENTVRIRMRYLAGVSAEMRVSHVNRDGGTDYYYISNPLDIMRRGKELHLICTRVIE